MRKSLLSMFLLFAIGMTANAQKFALIDMEYILKNIPAYQSATEELDQASRQWQSEVEKLGKEAKGLYDSYQAMYPDFLSLTGDGYIPEMYKKYGKVVSLMG